MIDFNDILNKVKDAAQNTDLLKSLEGNEQVQSLIEKLGENAGGEGAEGLQQKLADGLQGLGIDTSNLDLGQLAQQVAERFKK